MNNEERIEKEGVGEELQSTSLLRVVYGRWNVNFCLMLESLDFS